MNDRLFIGKQGEDAACSYLVENGFKIIERNFRRPWGELDIVAQYKDGLLTFVEVKTMETFLLNATKDDDSQGIMPEDQATRAKLRKTKKIAAYYAAAHPEFVHEEKGWRIDLLALTPKKGGGFEVRHYENI